MVRQYVQRGMIDPKLYCRKDKANPRTKVAPIYFIVPIQGKTYKIPTGLSCHKDAWQQKAQQVDRKYTNSNQINRKLLEYQQVLKDLFEIEPDIERVKQYFKVYQATPRPINEIVSEERIKEEIKEKQDTHAELSAQLIKRLGPKLKKKYFTLTDAGKEFFLWVEAMIYENRNTWSDLYQRKFSDLRTKILGFDPNFHPSKFSKGWMQDFMDYCFNDLGNEHNTVQSTWERIRVMCDQAKSQQIPFNQDIYEIKMKYIEPQIQPLDWDQVQAIKNVDLSGSSRRLEEARYVWVAAAYLGQRWSDIKRMNRLSFTQRPDKNGKLRWWYLLMQEKGKKIVRIPLLDEAVEWISQRNWEIPKLSHQKINKYIKEAAKLAGITEPIQVSKRGRDGVEETVVPQYETVHIHTARHSFAIEMVKRSLGRPFADKFVSEMLGHASHATTWKYINFVSSHKDEIFFDILDNA